MQDLTEYSDDELTLVVMNDESLYNMRRDSNLKSILKEYFIFTEKQWDEFEENLTDDEF